MNRREFLKGSAALLAAHAFPLHLQAEGPPAWAIGFEGVSEDLPRLPMQVQGKVPETCRGTLFRNGPALYQRAGRRYHHWFDPDGMLQAFRIGAGEITHEGRFVRTRKFLEEADAGRFLVDGAGTRFEDAVPPRNNESMNVANINVQPLNGELLALWEAGSAYAVDPDSLETLGQRYWSDELRGVPFSAHPRFDDDGGLWNIGSIAFGPKPMLVLYHVGADGRLRKSRLHHLDFAGYMHDFVLTDRYLLALNSSAVLGRGETFVDRFSWQPGRPSQLLVFDRDNFELVPLIDVPATFVFHFGNGWERGGRLEFTASAYPDSRIVTEGMRKLALRQPGDYFDPPEFIRYSVDLAAGVARLENLEIDMEFPAFDRRAPFNPQALFGVAGSGHSESGLSSAIARIDPRSGRLESYDYGDGIIVEEPQRVGGEHIIHSYLDYRRGRTGIAILAAENLADGPIATAEMTRVLPLGFHGCFLGS